MKNSFTFTWLFAFLNAGCLTMALQINSAPPPRGPAALTTTVSREVLESVFTFAWVFVCSLNLKKVNSVPITTLPAEVLETVSRHLPLPALHAFSRSCKSANVGCVEELQWHRINKFLDTHHGYKKEEGWAFVDFIFFMREVLPVNLYTLRNDLRDHPEYLFDFEGQILSDADAALAHYPFDGDSTKNLSEKDKFDLGKRVFIVVDFKTRSIEKIRSPPISNGATERNLWIRTRAVELTTYIGKAADIIHWASGSFKNMLTQDGQVDFPSVVTSLRASHALLVQVVHQLIRRLRVLPGCENCGLSDFENPLGQVACGEPIGLSDFAILIVLYAMITAKNHELDTLLQEDLD